jgi:NAD-dependent deacetylase
MSSQIDRKKLVVLSGAGMSAESGIRTFRDTGGLWEDYSIHEVATPQAWAANPELVLRFYNDRRAQLDEVEPNAGHRALAELESKFEVRIITQNVDDLHERAESSQIMHLHGELRKCRSSMYPNLIYPYEKDIALGDQCEQGAQLRPHIVWFGEDVPMMGPAMQWASEADLFLVIGTSLEVYPAASLIDFVPQKARSFLIDPHIPEIARHRNIECIAKGASDGMQELIKLLSA